MDKSKCLIFDLDGTLWDAIDQIKDAWNEVMVEEKTGIVFSKEMILSYMGLTGDETAPLAFPPYDHEEGMRLFRLCVHHEIVSLAKNPGSLYPNEKDTLEKLSKSYPLYLISNSDKGYVENYLSSCGTDKYFSGHLCWGDTKFSKADNIVYLIKKEGLGECIYIGDTRKDMLESEKAGVAFIHASYGFGRIDEKVNSIKRFDELPSAAKECFDVLFSCK
ncbi:MAG: HAD family hydrolase [Bacilli bacterium]|jgi:phosphoglycolate phosphatase|nr:HAD family hydrolase [Bacilli bacterium]MCH4210187.1 HAD family hydrolase [Bacilli bacterium]MCH4277826.1 HAD family hydrolase [Bacilli bacterium]MCI2055185.1 HAD family hydrolase [Bacilli bacterium]